MKISGKIVRRGGIALVLAGLALARIARGESPPPATFAPGDVHDVTFVHLLKDDSRRFDRIWEPYIATWTDSGVDDAVNRMTVNPQANLVAGRGLGRTVVMVAYGRKLAGKTDMGDIVCARSLDGGKTWWEPVTVFDSSAMNGTQQFAFANAILFHPSNQNLVWCFAMRCPLDFSDSEDSHMCAAYSADGGLSWHPVELVMHYHQPLAIIPGVLEVKVNGNTRYLLPAQRNTRRHDVRGDTQQLVLESDNLIEWRPAGYVPQAQPETVFLHEGGIALGEHEGEIKMVMRTAHLEGHSALTPPRAYSSTTRDFGHTWSLAVPEPALYNAVAKGYYGTISRGRHIYVYNDGAAFERRVLRYVVQDAQGQWSAPRVFFDGGTHNSYPTLQEESPGHYLCTWDSSTDPDHHRTAIRFGRLDLP